MTLLRETARWLTDPDSWTGPNGLLALTGEHIWVSVLSTLIAAALAIPPAIALAHRRRGRFTASALVNIGRAVPSFGIIVVTAVVFIRLGIQAGANGPLIVALVLLGLPPIFTNAYTGVAEVDPATTEAARGTGLTEREVLWDVELPLGLPVLLTGVRLAFAQIIATVALGAVLGSGGGLGRPILLGFATADRGGGRLVLGGAVLVAVLTLAGERGFSLVERAVTPTGVRRLVSHDWAEELATIRPAEGPLT